METINNIANTAAKAIWGEQDSTTAATTAGNETRGQEPVSGLQGKGTAEAPFDQGNAEHHIDDVPGNADIENSSSASVSGRESSTFLKYGPDTPANTTRGVPNPLENIERTGVTDAPAQKHAPKGNDAIPTERSDSLSAPASSAVPFQKHQGADQSQLEPMDKPEPLLKKRDPNDHSGEPMHMHGTSSGIPPATHQECHESKVGLLGGEEHGKSRGTGEKHTKTSGLYAEGGNFDAAKAGAAIEADRILEQSGVQRQAAGSMDKSPGTGSAESKPSKLHKIKDKLHIGHKD